MTSNADRPRVFLDVNVGEEPAGRLVIELFTDKTPRTCENVRSSTLRNLPELQSQDTNTATVSAAMHWRAQWPIVREDAIPPYNR